MRREVFHKTKGRGTYTRPETLCKDWLSYSAFTVVHWRFRSGIFRCVEHGRREPWRRNSWDSLVHSSDLWDSDVRPPVRLSLSTVLWSQRSRRTTVIGEYTRPRGSLRGSESEVQGGWLRLTSSLIDRTGSVRVWCHHTGIIYDNKFWWFKTPPNNTS